MRVNVYELGFNLTGSGQPNPTTSRFTWFTFDAQNRQGFRTLALHLHAYDAGCFCTPV